MITRFALRAGTSIESASRRHIRLVTNDGIDPLSPAGLVKLQSAVQISMIRDRQRVHAKLFGPRNKRIDRTGSIQQTVMTMAMQMSKWRRRHRGSFPSKPRLPAPEMY